MKYMLIFATAVALAVASPRRSLIDPDSAGPAPAPKPFEPIAIGPTIFEFEAVGGGPSIVDPSVPIVPGPTPVLPEEPITVPIAPAPATPIIQIILNFKGISIPGIVVPSPPIEVAPSPPIEVIPSPPIEVAPSPPVVVIPVPAPEPVEIGIPIAPEPEVAPEELN